MTTKILKSMKQFIRRGNGENLNLFRYAAMVIMLLTLGIGNAWAGNDSYKADFKATGGATGVGYVYASTTNSATPQYVITSDDIDATDLGSESGKTKTYYAWAKAVRGSVFKEWTVSNASGSAKTGNADAFVVTANSKNGTVTGDAKANWTTYTKVNVTYNASDDGEYTVAYSYNTYDATNKTITAGDAEGLGCTINSDNGSKTIGSYYNDVITLTSTKGDFQGWYKASDTNNSSNLLSTDNPYTYVAPQSGTGAIYPKYAHTDKYYGRLTASIAEVPYSMPAGGMIFISKEEAATPTYSDAAQTVDNVGMGTTSLTYYLKAQPTDKRYVFRGWYSNAQCTGTPLSTNKEYTYSFTASSTNSASPTTGNIYAAFDFNLYYMQVDVEPGTASQGLGMVIVSDQSLGTPEYTQYASYSEQFLYAYRLAPTANAYLYAKAKYGYKFSGWYDNAACTGTALSTANPYTYAAKGTSTDPMNPTIVPVYAKFVEDATTINITYNLPDQTKGEYTASVLDIVEVDDEYVWTFTEVFTSAGKTANTTQAQHKSDVLRLEAACKAGYGVTSWTDAGTAKTTPSHLYETTGTATGKTYGVAFGDAKPFLVSTNSTQYATLAEALTAVGNSGQITVVQNAYVPAGNYAIPSGVTLLVPYESTGKSYTSPSKNYEKIQEFSSATQYVLLTLSSGVNISLSGKLIVMADLCAPVGGGAGSGAPLSAYGRIAMSENSTITINSGANLYCWGYITGIEGLVTAKSGAKIHEIFQHQNNPGGTAASGWNEDAFFLNQYYVQNIESPLKMEYGAIETVYAQMTVPSSTINNLSASLIGKDDVGMFALTSSGSYLIRTYDPSTDRITYDIYGNVKLNYISMSVYGMDLNTSKYVLPITSNMSVKCHTLNGNASTFNIQYAVSFIPGAELFADEGVTLNIQNKLIIYDRDEWIGKNFAQFNKYSGGYNWTRSSFTPTRTYIRVNADLVDAKVDLNGTMNVSGSLYTTNSGATIISSNGTGVVKLSSAAPGNSNDIQYSANKLGASIKVPMTPAKLHNADDSYTTTAGSVSGDKFYYNKNLGKWLKNPKTVTWNANGGTTEATTMAYSEGAFIGELPAAYKEGHTLAGWFTAADGGTQIAPTNKVTANTTYYAHWTPKQYNITYMDQGKVPFSGTHVDEPNAHPTKHTYGKATTLNGVNNKANALFDGWYTISNCKAESKVTSLGATAVSKDITLYAKWIPLYTLTVAATPEGYGTVSASSVANVPEGSAVTVTGNKITVNGQTITATPTAADAQYTYEFDHWNNVPATVTGNVANIQAIFTHTTNTYTVIWKNGDDTLETDEKVAYGATPHFDGETPTKAADAQYTYTFSGWSPAISSVEGNVTYTAQFGSTVNKYDLTVQANDPSMGTVTGGGEYDYNSVHTITATPTSGFKFVKWNDDNTENPRSVTVTADVTYTATFDYDIANYTVKHWQQNISDDNYTEVTGDQQVIPGTIGTTTAAEAKTYTGFTAQPFDQQTIVVGGNTVNIYYDREKFTITWKDGQNEIEPAPTTWRYGAKPSFDYQKGQTTQYTYTLTGWMDKTSDIVYALDNLPNVTKDAVYVAQINPVIRQYTITFVNDDNMTVLQSSNVNYGVAPTYNGETPISTISDEYMRVFKGWTPDIVDVAADARYKAVYDTVTILDVPGEETISVNTTVDVTTVHVAGKLTVNSGTLTTTDLILEGSEGASGEVIGEVTATNAYFDLSHEGGFKANTWYAVAVPWQVSVTAYAEDNGVYIKNGSADPIRQKLGTTFDLIYYDGARRAGGAVKAWNFVEDDQTKDKKHYTMEPGRAYMIYLTSDADVIRFERKEGAELHTANVETKKYAVSPGVNKDYADWNGIANPATYHAYLNVGATDNYGQIYNADTKQYELFDMSEKQLVVGQPIFVQPLEETTIKANASSNEYSPVPAPRRAKAMTTPLTRYEILFAASEEDATDRIIVRMDEEKEENAYVIGQDLVKMGVSDRVPQMWIDRYDSKMCINTVAPINNTADYPLGISVQKDGEYDLFIDDQPNDETMLYLTYDGEAIWNLSYGGYVATLTKGTNTHYGLRIVYAERRTPTGIEEATIQNGESIRKVLVDDKVFIIRGNNVYSIDGQLVK